MTREFSWQRWIHSAFSNRAAASARNTIRRTRRRLGELQVLEDRTLLTGQQVDLNFGTNGSVITNLQAAGKTEVIHDVAIQVDEKIVVAGSSWNGTNNDFVVGRYLANGAVDPSFGTNGFVKLDFFGKDDEAWGVALQSDGKIVVAGSAGRANGNVIAFARLTAAGVLDTTFGTASFGMPGKITRDLGSTSVAYDIAVQPDDKIVLVGDVFDGHRHDSGILRYEANGLEDNVFGTFYTYFGGGIESGHSISYGVALQPDGKIVAAGRAIGPSGSYDMSVARYLPTGGLDTSFDGDGRALIDLGSTTDVAYGVAINAQGRIVIAGSSGLAGGSISVAQLNADGSLDSGFSDDGKATAQVFGASVEGRSLFVQPDGKLVVAGDYFESDFNGGGTRKFAALRFSTNGAIDASFGTTGIASVFVSTSNDNVYAVAYQGGGNILLAGSTADDTNFALTRLNSVTQYAGVTDSSFGERSGYTYTNFYRTQPTSDSGDAMILSLQQTYLIAGTTRQDRHDQLLLASYQLNGTANPAFGGGDGWTKVDLTGPFGKADLDVKLIKQDTDAPNRVFVLAASKFSTGDIDEYFVVCFNTAGVLDSTWGTNGVVRLSRSQLAATIDELDVAPGGKVVLAGTSHVGQQSDYFLARLNTNGSFDTTLNGTGKRTYDLGGHANSATTLLVLADGSILIGGESLFVVSGRPTIDYLVAILKVDASGVPVINYGSDGVAIVNLDGGDDVPMTMSLAPDGGLFVVGSSGPKGVGGFGYSNYSDYDFSWYAKVSAGGVWDDSFGGPDPIFKTEGILELLGFGKIEAILISGEKKGGAYEAAIEPDGRVTLVSRFSSDEYPYDQNVTFHVEEFDIAGRQEDSFHNGNGYLQYDDSPIRGLVRHSDGKVAFTGSTYNASTGGDDFHVMRLTPVGQSDTSFGDGGQVVGDFADVVLEPAVNFAVGAGTYGGSIYVVGTTVGTAPDAIALAKYKSNGRLDDAFGSSGRATYDLEVAAHDRASAIAIQSDGKIVVAGTSIAVNSGASRFFVARFLPDGKLDPDFGGGDGMVSTIWPQSGTEKGSVVDASAMVIDANGRILVGGAVSNGANNDFAIIAYDSHGNIDTAFDPAGTPGFKKIDIAGKNDRINGMILDSAGRLVVTGSAVIGTTEQIAVGRLNRLTGALDTTFSGDGLATQALGISNATGLDVIVDAQNNLIVGGYAYVAGNVQRAAFLKVRNDGVVDTSFGTGGSVLRDIIGFNRAGNVVSLYQQPDGKIVFAGQYGDQPIVGRLNANGTADGSFFNSSGADLLLVGNGVTTASAVVTSGDAKLVVVGSTDVLTTDADTADFFLYQLHGDGPPTTSISAGNGVAGAPVSFTITTTDLSASDLAAGFRYDIDWTGDGITDQSLNGAATAQVSHTFTTPQVNKIRVTATELLNGQPFGLSHSFQRAVQINYRPVADAITISTVTGAIQRILLTGNDNNSEVTQNLTFVITEQPAVGTLGAVYVEGGNSFVNYTPPAGYKGPASFKYTVSDDASAGGSGLTSAPVTVNITVQNAGPIVSIDNFAAINEGQSITFTGTFTDANPGDTHPKKLWTILTDDRRVLATVAGTSITYTPPQSGRYHVVYEVTDNEGAPGYQDLAFVVNNLAPTVSLHGSIAGIVNQPRTFYLSASDENAFDQTDNFEYDINFGDSGSSTQTVIGAARHTVQHSYATAGTFTVSVSARNVGTNEVSAAATQTIVINNSVAGEGPVGPVQSVSDTGSTNAVVAMAADGSYVIAWVVFTGNFTPTPDRDVWFRRFDASGSPLTAAARVNTTTTHLQEEPAIAMNDDGTFVIVWQHRRNIDVSGSDFTPELRGQRFNAQGQPQGTELSLVTGVSYGHGVGIDQSGNFVVSWSTGKGYAQRFSATGVAQGDLIQLTPNVNDNAFFPTVAMNDAGAFVVGYRAGLSGGDSTFYALRFDALGQLQGERIAFGNGSNGSSEGPNLLLRDNGEFITAFIDASGSVSVRRFLANGSINNGGFITVDSGGIYSPRPFLALEPDGDFIVTWSKITSGVHLFARRYAADGVPRDAAFEVIAGQFGSSTGSPDDGLAVATNGVGTAFVHLGRGLTRVYATNLRPQTTDIPPVTVQQGSTPTTLNLPTYFSDPETASSALTYSVVSVTGTAGLFDSTTINGSQQLVLTYAASKTGTAMVTIRAADASGATIDTALRVNVVAVAAPTVSADVAFPFGINYGRLETGTTQLVVHFSQPMSNAATVANYELRRAGANGLLEAGDALIPIQATYDAADQSATLTFAALVDDVYRLTIKSTLTNVFGTALDGDNNGTAGGNYVRDFVAAPTPANTQSPDQFLSPHGFVFDAQRAGTGVGQLIQGKNDTFDGALRLFVNGVAFNSFSTVGQQSGLVTGAENTFNLLAQRRITVPPIGNDDFARSIDFFYAIGAGTTVTAQPMYVTNLSGTTTVVTTSDGDAVLETTDSWFMTDDADGAGSPAMLQFLRGANGLQPASIGLVGDNVSWTYNISVPGNSTLGLAHFTILADSRAAAIASANALVTSSGFGGQAAFLLDQSERLSLANFVFGTLAASIDGSATLTVTDASAAGTNNQLSLSRDGSNNLVITDTSAQFKSVPANTTLSNGDKTLTVPPTAVTGGAIVTGASGNDVLTLDNAVSGQLSASGLTFNGGAGTDSLQLSGSGLTLDLTTLADSRLQSIEQIDITGSGNNTLTLNQAEVLNISETKTLIVRRNTGDTVNIGSGWSASTFENISGTTFEVFTQGAATLKVQALFEIRVQTVGALTIVNEAATTSSFTVALTAPPTSNVVLAVSSGDLTEATVGPAALTFTPANWNVPQTVTVTGVNDAIIDDTQSTAITVSVVDASSENRFDPAIDQTVNVLTTDNDFAGFVITESNGATSVSESGTTDTLTVALTAQPIANVVLTVSSGDTGEMTVSPGTLTFTPTNWNVPQTVTVTGVTDTQVDGNQTSPLIVSVSSAGSSAFAAVSNQIVSVTTIDNNEFDVSINLTGSQQAVVQSSGGNLQVLIDNVVAPAFAGFPASRIRSINITGDVGSNLIDLRNVTSAAFTRTSGVNVSVQAGDGQDTVLGSAFGDNISGDDGNDLLDGGAANDSLIGGNGNDQLIGAAGDDTLTGAAGDDTLTGAAGNDTLNGGAGGSDLLSESAIVDLTLTPTQLTSVSAAVTEIDTLSDIDRAILFGGSVANTINAGAALIPVTIFGGSGNDILIGGSQPDQMDGQGGNDTITGGGGSDSLMGGTGNDLVREAIDQDLTLSNATLIASGNARASVSDNLTTIELAELSGGVSRNRIDLSGFTVSLGATINGGGQSDTIIGSPGPDAIFTLTGADSIQGLGGSDIVVSGSGNDTISGGDGDDNLNGQTGNDSILGDNGNDVLVGGAGIDTMSGGLGNDFLSGQTDAGLLSGGDGNDTLQGNLDKDTLNGDVGDDRLYGLQGDDIINGGDGADSLVGAIGNDSISGGPGLDTLQGDLGNDTLDGGADFDRINEVLDTNITVTATNINSGLGVDIYSNMERIQLSGGVSNNFFDARLATVPLLLAGDAGNDTLLGGSKADGILGGEGDDVLSGGAGNDIIDGGNGVDYIVEKANADFTVSGVTITSAITATGTDTPTFVERIVLIGGAGGNKLDASQATISVILIGGPGNDTLLGGTAADTLSGGNRTDSTVAGSDGADSLDGGLGADTLETDSADTLITAAGDTTLANVFASLPSWIDTL